MLWSAVVNEVRSTKPCVVALNPRVTLTPDLWSELYQVNTKVNTTIAPMTDQELYGQAEYWTYPTDAGDCEDYLLLKKRELEAMGFDSGALLITVVLDEKKEGHAVLTVASTDGDYVLDNRRLYLPQAPVPAGPARLGVADGNARRHRENRGRQLKTVPCKEKGRLSGRPFFVSGRSRHFTSTSRR